MNQFKIDFDKVIESLKLSNENIDSRKKNFNQFLENGFPNKKVEDWKFSDLNQIISSNIKNLRFHSDLVLSKIDKTIFIDKFVHNKIVFLNGAISKIDFSHEDDAKILLTKDLNQNENFKEVNPLVSLNNALNADYIRITVKENYSLSKPLIIYNITTKDLKSTVLNLKTDIILKSRTDQFIHNPKIFEIFENYCSSEKILVPDIGTYRDKHRASDLCQIAYRKIMLDYWNNIPLYDGFTHEEPGEYLTKYYVLKIKNDNDPWKLILRKYFYVKSYYDDFQIEFEKLHNFENYKIMFDLAFDRRASLDII